MNLTFQVDDLCKRFTADIVGQSIFGLEVKSFRDLDNDFFKMTKCLMSSFNKKKMVKTALQIVAPNFFDFFSFIKFETVNQLALAFVYKVVEKIIEFREKTGTVGKDIMQLLIQLKKFGKLDGDNGEKNVSGKFFATFHLLYVEWKWRFHLNIIFFLLFYFPKVEWINL